MLSESLQPVWLLEGMFMSSLSGDDGVAVGVAARDEVIARLMAYCERADVERQHQAFCREHVGHFHGFRASYDDEKSHKVHELFQDYEHLFERTLQGFLDAEDMSPDVFYKHCRRLEKQYEATDDDSSLLNLRIILSALDFDQFCQLMEREAIETQRALKEAEDMGF